MHQASGLGGKRAVAYRLRECHDSVFDDLRQGFLRSCHSLACLMMAILARRDFLAMKIILARCAVIGRLFPGAMFFIIVIKALAEIRGAFDQFFPQTDALTFLIVA